MATHSYSDDEHPGRRPAEPADPMELTAGTVLGDAEAMLNGIIEEFAGMGYGANQILELFEQPFYRATYRLGQELGLEAVRERVGRVTARRGVMRFTDESLRLIHESP